MGPCCRSGLWVLIVLVCLGLCGIASVSADSRRPKNVEVAVRAKWSGAPLLPEAGYERFLKIMILSVLKRTRRPVKFWFIKNYLSPPFKVIFVDADQIVRADMGELYDMDLEGKPLAYTPFCDNNKEMDGYRFWRVSGGNICVENHSTVGSYKLCSAYSYQFFLYQKNGYGASHGVVMLQSPRQKPLIFATIP